MTYSDPFIDYYSNKNLDFMNFYTFDNVFTPEEIDYIIELGNNLNLRDGKVNGGRNDLNTDVRKSEIGFFNVDEDTKWIFDRILI